MSFKAAPLDAIAEAALAPPSQYCKRLMRVASEGRLGECVRAHEKLANRYDGNVGCVVCRTAEHAESASNGVARVGYRPFGLAQPCLRGANDYQTQRTHRC